MSRSHDGAAGQGPRRCAWTRAGDLERLWGKGIGRAYVHLDGWGVRGYDNLHPDALPPAPEAGGWDGMRRLSEACDRLGYLFAIHDQYRDLYLDVFSVVPPEECYATEHPISRSACLVYRGTALDSVRAWGGIVSSEEPSDWSVRHLDLVHHGPYALNPNPGKGPAMGIPVPLFNLVYHDALLVPWSLERGAWGIPERELGFLHALGNAGLPYLSLNPGPEELARVRAVCALHRRVGLLELTGHEFLDANRRRQRFSYADGTRITIDLEADTWKVEPALDTESQ